MAEGGDPPRSEKYECPVCHEAFIYQPKLLPCAHIVCRACVLSWLKADGDRGCPLCRSSILPVTLPGQSDITTFVDNLPTDMVTLALMEGKKALSNNVCGVCDADMTATSFCLQCDVKLCMSCAKIHGKLPATRDHELEDLKTLTAERLAASRRSPCDRHPDKPAELFCTQHRALLCVNCFTCHSSCSGVKNVDHAAADERKLLTEHVQKLRDKEAVLAERISQYQQVIRDEQEHFKSMRSQVKVTYHRLKLVVEKRHQEMMTLLQEHEEQFVTPRLLENVTLEKERTNLCANAHAVELLVGSSGNSALFGMLDKLGTRLADLEKAAILPVPTSVALSSVWFDFDQLVNLERSIAEFGQVKSNVEMASALSDGSSGLLEHSADGPHDAQAAASNVTSSAATSATAVISAGKPAAQSTELHVGAISEGTKPLLGMVVGMTSGAKAHLAEAYAKFTAKAVENAVTQVTSHTDDVTPLSVTPRARDPDSKASRSNSWSSDMSASDLLPFAGGFHPHAGDHAGSKPAIRNREVVRRHTMPDDVFSSDYLAEWRQPEPRHMITAETPRPASHGSLVADHVRRGPNWSPLFLENLDGTPPRLGTIIQYGEGDRARGTGWVNVRWEATGRSRWYRMGAEGCYDVELVRH